MKLDGILDELDKRTREELRIAEDEDFKKFMKGAMAISQHRGNVSSGSYEEDLKKMRGDADYDPEEPNKNGDIFGGVMADMYAKGIVSRQSVIRKLMGDIKSNSNSGPNMAAPVRPQQWTRHKPSFDREYALEHEAEH